MKYIPTIRCDLGELSIFRCLWIVVFSWVFTSSFCQTRDNLKCRMEGRVFDEKGSPIEFAVVSCLNKLDSSYINSSDSDSLGKYILETIPCDSIIIITVSCNGYETIFNDYKVNSLNGFILIDSLVLKSTSISLNEVEVVAKKPLFERKIDRFTVNVENSVFAIGNSALDVLKRSPGVSIISNSTIKVNGKEGINLQIDGRPTYLSTSDLFKMLEGLPASNVSSIDIITNPSSKYDAEGIAGVINIKLIKVKKSGFTSDIYGDYGYSLYNSQYGRYPKTNIGLNFKLRFKKFDFYTFGDHKTENGFQLIDINRNINADSLKISQSIHQYDNNKFNNIRTGVSYRIDDSNTLDILYVGNNNLEKNNSLNQTIYRSFENTDSMYYSTSLMTNKPHSNTISGIYERKIDTLGSVFNFQVDYSYFSRTSVNSYQTRFLNKNNYDIRNPLLLSSSMPYAIRIGSVKADYTYSLKPNITFEGGLKSTYVFSDNNLLFNVIENTLTKRDTTRSNHFIYKQSVNAAYASLKFPLNKMNFQIGMRAENTSSEGVSTNNGYSVKRSYLNFFPTFFLELPYDSIRQFYFSYSKRISRPDYQTLNPFIYYSDPLTFTQGNPYLKPQYTHSFEISEMYKDWLYISAYFNITNGIITQVAELTNNNKTTKYTYLNLDHSSQYGVSSNINKSLGKRFEFNINLNTYYKKYSSTFYGSNVNLGRLSYDLNSVFYYTFPKNFKAEVSASYNSSFISGIFLFKSIYQCAVGLKKTFMNDRANVSIRLNDVFWSYREAFKIILQDQNYSFYQVRNTRAIEISFNFKLIKSSLANKVQQKISGNQDEEEKVTKKP